MKQDDPDRTPVPPGSSAGRKSGARMRTKVRAPKHTSPACGGGRPQAGRGQTGPRKPQCAGVEFSSGDISRRPGTGIHLCDNRAMATIPGEGQIKSKQRVADHGEVLTGEREVKAMLDLVEQETARIESRFLEPACGTGNFLIEILRRKLAVVDARYRSSQLEWERNAVFAVTSLYGIDILEDNVEACRARLLGEFRAQYEERYGKRTRPECVEAVRFLLRRNIVWDDALTLRTVGVDPGPIVFSEWSPVNGSLLERRDFAYHELVNQPQGGRPPSFGPHQPTLFGEEQGCLFASEDAGPVSDTGETVFIPEPVREYPLVHYLELWTGNE